MKMHLTLLAALLALPLGLAGAGDLAHRLPPETILYVQLDLPRLLAQLRRQGRSVDSEAAEGLEGQLGILHECLKEFAAAREFEPQLLDTIFKSKLYGVLLAKAEPERKVRKYKVPKWDPETYEIIEGEFDERTVVTVKEYTFSTVIETTEEAAADFIAQYKAFQDRMKEKDPEQEALGWKEVEVDHGEMITDPRGSSYVGRTGNYLVFSTSQPAELWEALSDAAEPSLAESALFKRYTQAEHNSSALGLLNLQAFLTRSEEKLKKNLEQARKKLAEGEGEEGGRRRYNPAAWRMRRAESALKSFRLAKAMGLGSLRSVGLNIALGATDDTAAVTAALTLELSGELPPTLKHLLNGGRHFGVPPLGKRSGLSLFLRLGLAQILSAAIKQLDEETAASWREMLAATRDNLGYTVQEIIEQFSGDFYFFLDIEEKESRKQSWDPETMEFVTKTVTGPRPELLILLGVDDREAFTKMLSDAVTRASSDRSLAAFIKKRVYQETDVYLIGADMDDEDAQPDGLSSYAVVVVDRYLSFGSWKDVTGLIRRAKAARKDENARLADLVARHQEANLLTVIPRALIEKLLKMYKKMAGADPLEQLAKGLEGGLNLPVEDEELAEKFKSALKNILGFAKTLIQKGREMAPEMGVLVGRHRGSFYEIRTRLEIKK